MAEASAAGSPPSEYHSPASPAARAALFPQAGTLFPVGKLQRTLLPPGRIHVPWSQENHGRQHAHTMHRRTGQAAVFFPILHGRMSGNRDKLHVTHIFIQRAAFFRARLESFSTNGLPLNQVPLNRTQPEQGREGREPQNRRRKGHPFPHVPETPAPKTQ